MLGALVRLIRLSTAIIVAILSIVPLQPLRLLQYHTVILRRYRSSAVSPQPFFMQAQRWSGQIRLVIPTWRE